MKLRIKPVGYLMAGLVLLMSSGCTSWFINREAYQAEALAFFQAGEDFYDRGDYHKAVASFSTVIKNYPRSGLVDDAYYLASLSFYKSEDWEHSVGASQKLISQFPDSPLASRVHMVMAQAYQHMGAQTRAMISYLDAYVYSQNPNERQKAELQARNLLGRESDYNVLYHLYKEYEDTPAAEVLLYRLGMRAFEVEDYADAELYFTELKRRFPDSPYIERIEGRETAAAALKGKLVCGLLLPLTGEFASYGSQVKKGVELAHRIKGSSNIHLEVYDTGSRAGGSREGTRILLRKGAKVIIGPLTSAEVQAAVPLASQAGVVVISPTSTDPGLLSLYECLFQLNSYPDQETRKIADFALSRGMKSYGILYPDTEQGRMLAQGFRSQVEGKGGRVVYSHPLSDTVENMKQTLLSIRHQKADALFLPFEEQQLLSVVPQIAYYKIPSRILGLDDFAERQVLRRGSTPFEGCWFAAPPGNLADPLAFEGFYGNYTRVHQDEPGWAATLGYDAYNFFYQALSQGEDISLCKALRKLPDRRGVMGRLIFSPKSDASSLKVYTIKEEEIKEIE